MRTLNTKAFTRFSDKADISDVALWRAVRDAERGLVAADFGRGVIKRRIACLGQGKSRGFRTLIVFKADTRAIFVRYSRQVPTFTRETKKVVPRSFFEQVAVPAAIRASF